MSSLIDAVAARVVPGRGRAVQLGRITLHLLDFVIALGRKVGGFCALLALGWIYFRFLVLGHGFARIHSGAPDADLRQTMWVALLLIMAQGWDIPTDQIVAHWRDMRACLPPPRWAKPTAAPAGRPQRRAPLAFAAPVVVHLGRFMDLCVAIANKVGAFAVLLNLLFLAEQFAFAGANVRAMYPTAVDPTVSFLADVSVYVVVLGWWAMPFEQIAIFWRRLRGRSEVALLKDE